MLRVGRDAQESDRSEVVAVVSVSSTKIQIGRLRRGDWCLEAEQQERRLLYAKDGAVQPARGEPLEWAGLFCFTNFSQNLYILLPQACSCAIFRRRRGSLSPEPRTSSIPWSWTTHEVSRQRACMASTPSSLLLYNGAKPSLPAWVEGGALTLVVMQSMN